MTGPVRPILFVVVIAIQTVSAGNASTLKWAGSLLQDSLPKEHPSYVTAFSVYRRIVAAVGTNRQAPELIVRPKGAVSSLKIAWFHPLKNIIVIDEETFELCRAFGPNGGVP